MGLTDKHLAYGDDIPQTQTEKDYYWQIKHLEEKNDKLKEAIWKIKADISDSRIGKYGIPNETIKIEDCLKIIDKHLREVDNG